MKYKCYQCLEHGYVEVLIFGIKSMPKPVWRQPIGPCSVCGGSGKIDWVENATRANEIEYFEKTVHKEEGYVSLKVSLNMSLVDNDFMEINR